MRVLSRASKGTPPVASQGAGRTCGRCVDSRHFLNFFAVLAIADIELDCEDPLPVHSRRADENVARLKLSMQQLRFGKLVVSPVAPRTVALSDSSNTPVEPLTQAKRVVASFAVAPEAERVVDSAVVEEMVAPALAPTAPAAQPVSCRTALVMESTHLVVETPSKLPKPSPKPKQQRRTHASDAPPSRLPGPSAVRSKTQPKRRAPVDDGPKSDEIFQARLAQALESEELAFASSRRMDAQPSSASIAVTGGGGGGAKTETTAQTFVMTP